MIIYNVTITVDASIAKDYLEWFRTKHLHDMMDTGLFIKYELYRQIEPRNDNEEIFVIHFFLESMQSYRRYIDEHGQMMRNKYPERFREKFKVLRVMTEPVSFLVKPAWKWMLGN